MTMGHQSAAMLVIGNEILSGRTHELNAHVAAGRLFKRGCRMEEIVIVPDIAARIIKTLNRLREHYDAVITSGGIGPTHDDITMQSVADAFGVPLVEHDGVIDLMTDRYGEQGLTDGRRRMAMVPEGADLVRCEKTIAPGVHLGNVYVLAGVPDIFTSQIEAILADFGGRPFLRREIEVQLPESLFSDELGAIQQRYPAVEIGSYPNRCGGSPCGKICMSGQDAMLLEQAEADVEAMLGRLS
ncbi:MAG TPA: molybdopterin-binding protein [Mariprofundaceae bacterium]|nr:molybdopterin-binding protein [Mariprofundaceae bacterium]